MIPDPFTPPTAADVARLFRLSVPARALLTPDLPARGFYDTLVSAGHLADARRLLAHAMPARRAIWWATLCLQHAAEKTPLATPEEELAFDAGVRWVLGPSEATRRGAESAGWAAKPTTSAGILAMACFLSSGNISRPGLPPVFAVPHLAGRLAGVVVYLASVRYDPAHYLHHLRQYLVIGQEVAAGRNLPPGGAEPERWSEPRCGPANHTCCERVSNFLAAGPASVESVPGEALFASGMPGGSS